MQALKSQRDELGKQREYETIYILRPDATTDQIHDVNCRIRKVIEDLGGKVLNIDNWGKRKLAYEVRKQLKGIYLYWLYLGESALVSELERNLRMIDLVIRYYTVKVEEGVDPNARPSSIDEERFVATATIVPDEEDAYLGRGGYENQENSKSFEESEEEKEDESVSGESNVEREEKSEEEKGPDKIEQSETSHSNSAAEAKDMSDRQDEEDSENVTTKDDQQVQS